MSERHSPGPWFRAYRQGGELIEIQDANGRTIAAKPYGMDPREWVADSTLMAAAHELLAALSNALWLLECEQIAEMAACDGRTRGNPCPRRDHECEVCTMRRLVERIEGHTGP